MLKGSSSNRRYAIASPPPPTGTALPQFGIATGYLILTQTTAYRATNLDKTVEVGATMIRFDSTSGNQSQVDTVVADATARGLKCLLVLYGSADGTGPPAVGAFAASQATKWLGNSAIAGFEICNEPDLHNWTVNNYADFVAGASDAIKAVDPTRIVVAGALWKGGGLGSATDPKAFTVALCTRAAGKFDYLSCHLYDDPLTRASWNIWDWVLEWGGTGYCDSGANGGTVRKALNDNGHTNIPIISTESGAPLEYPRGTPKYTLAEQAAYVANGINEAKSGHIASICIYQMTDDSPDGDLGLLHMLTDTTYTTRPAFYSMQEAITGGPPSPSTGWTRAISTLFTTDGVLPAPWLAYGPFASGYAAGGYYLPSHVIVAGGICTLLMGYESSGPGAGVRPAYNSTTGAGWYQGTIYAAGGFGAIDQRTTVRLRVVSTNGIVSHRNLPLWWPNTGNWPTDGEEDYFESDPAWNPPVAGKELPYGYFHYGNPPGVHQFVYNAWPRVDLSQWHVYRMQRLNHKISIWVDDMITPVWEHQWTALELPDAFKHPVFQQEFPNNTTSPTGTTGSERIEIDWITVDIPASGGGGLVVQNNFETGLASGTAITIANSDDGSPSAGNPVSAVDQGAAGASVVYDTAQAAHGTRSLKFTQGTPATGTPLVGWDVPSSSTVYGRFYIRVPALPSAAAHIVEFWTGSAYGGFIDINPAGTLSVVDATFAGKLTTAAVITANSWFRVELKYDISTTVGKIQLKVFALDSTSALVDSTSTTGNFGAATTGPGHYISAAAPGFIYWLDDIEYNDTTWPGPAA